MMCLEVAETEYFWLHDSKKGNVETDFRHRIETFERPSCLGSVVRTIRYDTPVIMC